MGDDGSIQRTMNCFLEFEKKQSLPCRQREINKKIKKVNLYLVNKEKIKLEKKSYLLCCQKREKLIGKINLSLPCEKRENYLER